MTSHRAEAIRALQALETMLTAAETLDAMQLCQALATLGYARACVAAIQEVKRVRTAKGVTT